MGKTRTWPSQPQFPWSPSQGQSFKQSFQSIRKQLQQSRIQQQGFNNQGFNNQGFNNQGFNVQMQGIFKKNFTYALLCSANQSKCLQVAKDGHVVIADFNGNMAQKYIFQFDQNQKKYHIKASANLQYLAGPGLFAGADIVTKPHGQKAGTVWTIEPSKKVGKGFNLRSFTGHTIDVPANNYTNGTRVQKHGFHGDVNQTFLIVER